MFFHPSGSVAGEQRRERCKGDWRLGAIEYIALRNKEQLPGALQINYGTMENIASQIAFGNALNFDAIEPSKHASDYSINQNLFYFRREST